MAATASLRVIKTFPFKGGTRAYSNRYHFNGGTPADATHWHTLMDNVVTAEKAVHFAGVTITEVVGYAAGSDVPVATKNYTTAGTLTGVGSNSYPPGEVAALLRWSTNARSTKNHPIYCFAYFHHILVGAGSSNCDLIDANLKTALNTYGTAWVSGFSDGTITAVRATPQAAACTGAIAEEYATHRDFPHTPSL